MHIEERLAQGSRIQLIIKKQKDETKQYCIPNLILFLVFVLASLHINIINVQYNGGLLPDVILLALCHYIGELFKYHVELLSLQPMFPSKPFD